MIAPPVHHTGTADARLAGVSAPFSLVGLMRCLTLSLPALLCIVSCVPTQQAQPVPPGEDQRRLLLTEVADELVIPTLTAGVESASVLVQRTDAWRAAPTDVNARAAAQDAWRAAMDVVQRLEVLQVGPAAAPTSFTGGRGLRDRIYAFPQANPCGVDQQVVRNELEAPDFAETRLVNVLGMGALEYLLFVDGDGNACPGSAAINRNGEWEAIPVDERRRRRAVYAQVVARDIQAQLSTLRASWSDGFAAALKGAGTAGSTFPSAQQALDEIYAALFYVELLVKDRKLAVPAGLHIDCVSDVCPDKTESPFSQTSHQHVVANLESLQRVFLGVTETGVGFDDLLRDAGHTDAADTMTTHLQAAIDAARAFDGSYESALAGDPASVRALHATIKVFTDDFKGTLPSLLGLRVPQEGAGDND